MKKVLVILIVLCCCAHMVHSQNGWPFSQSASMPHAQMTSMSSSLVSMQGHERLAQACHTSMSNDYEASETTGNVYHNHGVHRVGPNKPNEPGAPVGDGLAILLICAVVYGFYRRFPLCRSRKMVP